MAQFNYLNEINSLATMDGPITRGPLQRWAKKSNSENINPLSTSFKNHSNVNLSVCNQSMQKLSISANQSCNNSVLSSNKTPTRNDNKKGKKTPSKNKSPGRSTTPTPNKASKTPNKADRFIPSRSNSNYDLCHYMLSREEDKNEEVVSQTAAGEAIGRALTDTEPGRLLQYTCKAPAAPEGYQNRLRVVYSQAKVPSSVKNTTRYIPQAPDRILDAPDILDDYLKKKNGHLERLSSSSSDTSIGSRDRAFPNGEHKSLCKGSGLVDCFFVKDLGIITVEFNATIKLWADTNLKLLTILNGRQSDVLISSAALQSNVLVLCEKKNTAFQTFELKKVNDQVELQTIQEMRLNNVIVSCDLTSDGNVLALGLDSGNVVVWNVRGGRQLSLLRHHKSKVHCCSFSPVPSRSNRNSMSSSPHPVQSPYHFSSPQDDDVDSEQPPLVLVTMATEIVWWNLTQVMKAQKQKFGKRSHNAMTPIGSPLENRSDTPNANNSSNATSSSSCNFFFRDGYLPQQCWKLIWKGKTCKQGSKRKEILACVKLSGMNAKRLSHDEKFSCFVTVDNSGHIHIMNVMRLNNT